jgi:hypothetical protein
MTGERQPFFDEPDALAGEHISSVRFYVGQWVLEQAVAPHFAANANDDTAQRAAAAVAEQNKKAREEADRLANAFRVAAVVRAQKQTGN